MSKDKCALHTTYFNLTKEYKQKYGEKTVLMMQVGAFFEVYGIFHSLFEGKLRGSNIDEICSICDLNKSSKSKGNIPYVSDDGKKLKCDLVMAGVRDYVVEKYVEKLTDEGYTVVLYAQEKDNPKKRYEMGIYTPGTQLKEDVGQISNNIMCISLYHRQPSKISMKNEIYYGVSSLDVITGETTVAEFNEQYYNNLTTYDDLERKYSILSPNETILCYNSENIPDKTIHSLINYVGIKCKLVRIIDEAKSSNNSISLQSVNCHKQKYQNEIFRTFYTNRNESDTIIQSIDEYECGKHSFAFLLDYTNSYNTRLTNNLRIPTFNTHSNNLVLETHSLKQLNILPLDGRKDRLSSVMSFANMCNTAMGRRAVNRIITSPIIDETELERQYTITDYCIDKYDTMKDFHAVLSGITDTEFMYRKLVNERVKPSDIYKLYSSLLDTRKIYKTLRKDTLLKKYGVVPRKFDDVIMKLIDSIQNTFDVEKLNDICVDGYSVNFFNKGIYTKVDEVEESYWEAFDITNAMLDTFDDIIKTEENKTKKTSTKYCKLHETDKSGFMVKITQVRGKKLLDGLKKWFKTHNQYEMPITYTSTYDGDDYETDVCLGDVTCSKRGNDYVITSQELDIYLGNIYTTKIELRNEIEHYFSKYCQKLLNYKEVFEAINTFIVGVDVMLCKAHLAIKYNYCRPQIDRGRDVAFLEATQMRHLLIEHINTEEIYVPNDVTLDASQNGILLFGTNAVGKSSLIKSIGICVIMAQAGFFVPCERFLYKPFHNIFTRILGNDNIFKGLSTFAVEMSELRTILSHSNDNSLVLGDEMCSGTELGSAISIFLAGLMKLHERESKFVFATHFHEVTDMKEIRDMSRVSMKHMSVHYDASIDGLVYDRIIRDGPGNNMYGLEVCKALNLPAEFIEMAHAIRNNNIGIENSNGPVSLMKTSRYNSQKVRGKCEMCGKPSVEVHHIRYQKDADKNGFIGHFHKNHKANLMNVCEECHDRIHLEGTVHKLVKSTNGVTDLRV